MSKPFLAGLTAALVLLVGATASATRFQQQDQSDSTKRRAELADATVIQYGAMSEQQRLHSKRFAYYKPAIKRTLREIMARAPGQDIRTVQYIGLGEYQEPVPARVKFAKLAAQADLVVVGTVTSKEAHLTDGETFVFTDYTIRISSVLKADPESSVADGDSIIVTRPGGKVVLDGILVTAEDEMFERLPSKGEEVLLFLSRVPGSATYESLPSVASFEVKNGNVRPLTRLQAPADLPVGASAFLQLVSEVVADRPSKGEIDE